MNKIIIDPHNCSREELQELQEYLTDKSWDWKEVPDESSDSESPVEPEKENRTVEILQHTVEYWFRNDDNYVDGICLDDGAEEHIRNKIEEGYSQGELCSLGQDGDEIEERGWWRIKK